MRESANVSGPFAEPFVRRTIIVIAVAMALLGYAAPALFLVCGGILFAILLRMLADRLSALLPRSLERWRLPMVVLILLAVIGGAALWAGPCVSNQLGRRVDQLPAGVDHFRQQLASLGDYGDDTDQPRSRAAA